VGVSRTGPPSQGETDAAGEAFARALAGGAPGGGAAFGTGLVHLARGESEPAESALRLALERDPEHEAAAVTLAQLLRSRGRAAEAAAVRGTAALARGESAAAVTAYREALSLAERTGAKPTRVLLDLARALQAAEDGPGALAALRRAAALAPEDASIARRQVDAAQALFAPQEALRAVERYERLRPAEDAQVAWWRFRAYRQLQDTRRAAEALATAARLAPEAPDILTWQARTLLENAPDASQVQAAGDLLRRAMRAETPAAETSEVEIHSSLAEVSLRRKQWVEAGEHLRRALALDPDWGHGRHWLQLAQADRGLGLAKEAVWDVARHAEVQDRRAALARARGAAAGHGGSLLAWATAALRAGRDREARSVARAAVRDDPYDPDAYRALAAASQRLGRLEDRIVAMEAARKAGRR
jgi:tetratricopeptide (TPR) repeat protein